jgi:hypothetical protein
MVISPQVVIEADRNLAMKNTPTKPIRFTAAKTPRRKSLKWSSLILTVE